MIDAPPRHDCVKAGLALAAVLSLLLCVSPATAQIAVTDPPVETSTATPVIFTKPPRPHVESQYTAPNKMPDNPLLTVWIVVRDERGGASWMTRQIQLIQP